jgi:outer membrane translocation and assembly module TamA
MLLFSLFLSFLLVRLSANRYNPFHAMTHESKRKTKMSHKQEMLKDETLKGLIGMQKLLKFEISQTLKAKVLANIDAEIAARMSPAKDRAKKIAARTGRNEGKLKIDGETAKFKVTLAQVKAHERTSVRIDMI